MPALWAAPCPTLVLCPCSALSRPQFSVSRALLPRARWVCTSDSCKEDNGDGQRVGGRGGACKSTDSLWPEVDNNNNNAKDAAAVAIAAAAYVSHAASVEFAQRYGPTVLRLSCISALVYSPLSPSPLSSSSVRVRSNSGICTPASSDGVSMRLHGGLQAARGRPLESQAWTLLAMNCLHGTDVSVTACTRATTIAVARTPFVRLLLGGLPTSVLSICLARCLQRSPPALCARHPLSVLATCFLCSSPAFLAAQCLALSPRSALSRPRPSFCRAPSPRTRQVRAPASEFTPPTFFHRRRRFHGVHCHSVIAPSCPAPLIPLRSPPFVVHRRLRLHACTCICHERCHEAVWRGSCNGSP